MSSTVTHSVTPVPAEQDAARRAASITSPAAQTVGTGADFLTALAASKQQAEAQQQQQQQRSGGGGGGAAAGSQQLGVDDGGVAAKRTKEQEKNRRAQARFRERQKVCVALHVPHRRMQSQ